MIFCFFDTDAMEERRNWSYWVAMFSYNVVLNDCSMQFQDGRETTHFYFQCCRC